MSFSNDLVAHSLSLMVAAVREEDYQQVHLRRAVSASYYALFHRISEDAVNLIAPDVSEQTNHRIQRWFEHGEMKRVCGRFLPNSLDKPLRDLIGGSAYPDLRTLAISFIQLQDARHSADYDLSYQLTKADAFKLLQTTADALAAWERLTGSAEANIFVLSLILWKNWDRERP